MNSKNVRPLPKNRRYVKNAKASLFSPSLYIPIYHELNRRIYREQSELNAHFSSQAPSKIRLDGPWKSNHQFPNYLFSFILTTIY
jgi:hypothetical protein